MKIGDKINVLSTKVYNQEEDKKIVKQKGIYIEGVIFKTNDVSLTEEEFADIFFPLIEAQGWMFGGAYMEEEDAED